MEGARGLWPFVARDEELALIDGSQRGGVVLFGDAGIGKSRLLAELTARVEQSGKRTVRVGATRSLASVPLGAFAAVLAQEPEAGAPFDALQRALRALAGDGDFKEVTLAVDDAHLLDDASAGLLILAVQSGARVLASVRSGEPCADAVTRLWKDDFALRVELRALDEDEVGRLLDAALGDPVDARARHRFFTATRGNLLFLRELVRHAELDGALVRRGGVWSWTAPEVTVPGVRDLVGERLQGVSPRIRAVVELLAISEPLGRSVVERIATRDALTDAEAAGVTQSIEAGRRREVRLVHPLYAEVVRDSLDPTRRAELAHSVANALMATGAARRDDRLRVALLQLDAGVTPPPDELNFAAHEIGMRGDLALAERLARAAIEAGGATASEILLGDILYWAQEHEALVALLGRELGADATPTQIAHAAMMVASSLYWGLGRFDDADAWLERGIQAVEPPYCDELIGQRSQMLMFAGYARESIEVGRTVFANPDASPEARLRAYAGMLCSLGMSGQIDAVDAELPTAMKLVLEAGPELFSFNGGGVLVAMFVARLFGGGLENVDALAGAMLAEAMQRVDDPFMGVWAFVLGRSALAQGRLADAAARLRDAASLLRDRDPGGVLTWALAALAETLGATDDRVGATEAMQELDAVRMPAMRNIDIDIELGRAWAASARGERSLARETAAKIGRSLLDEGKAALAGLALHDAVRLGADPATVIDALDVAASACEGPAIAACARHAQALIDDDLDALLETASAFESAGWLLHAAECAAGASRVAAAQGLQVRQREAAVRSADLASRCGPALTPLLETTAGRSALGSLTRREQEVALLAARGHSKREISDMLFLSVRTVGNHINHVYAKLGIASREELRVVLAVGDGAS
jgi:DNA-binding CsgD family transcriptional regulator